MRVKEAWKVVAKEGMSYAKAISSVTKAKIMKSKPDSAGALGGRPDSTVVSRVARGRADLIEAPIVKSSKMQWKMKISTCSSECQTETEVVEAVTQTTMDSATQTDFMPKEKETQTTADQELQADKVVENFDENDKFIITAMHRMIANLMRYRSRRVKIDEEYQRAATRFSKTIDFMNDHNYWENISDCEAEEDSETDERGPVTRQQTANAI